MHCLVLSDTFPNRLAPWRGPYNRRQIECLAKRCAVTVINPMPWPWLLRGAEQRALVSRADNVLEGIPLYHPLFWYAPGVGRGGTWRGILAAARRTLRELDADPFDVVLATFAYPHGYAATHLARELEIPCVVKARGSDLHALPSSGGRRRRTADALRDADAVVAVSGNLKEIAIGLGARPDRVSMLPNGVDASAFPAIPRSEARRRLGMASERKILLFIGSLLPVKGVDLLLCAFAKHAFTLEATRRPLLIVAGEGPMRSRLEQLAVREGLSDAVQHLGQISREDVALWMNAADAVALPSRNEGCPNVVLEALACGTPVVASRVGAVPDLLDESCGIMVEPNDVAALASAFSAALDRRWDRSAIRRRVEGMSWEANAQRLHKILTRACGFRSGR